MPRAKRERDSALSKIYLKFQLNILIHYTVNHCVDPSSFQIETHVVIVLLLSSLASIVNMVTNNNVDEIM
jgi:hypothetical protein